MTTSDYEIHLKCGNFENLWDTEDGAEGFPFGEDLEDIDRAISEELGTPPKRRRRKLNRQS
jgi:hypothetical protein